MDSNRILDRVSTQLAETLRLGGRTHFGSMMITEHICDTCAHATRCRDGLACRALGLFINTGRVSAAPRQPTREIFQRIFAAD